MKILFNAVIAKLGGAQVIINSFLENIDETWTDEYYFLVYKGSVFRNIRERLPQNIHVEETLAGDFNPIKKHFWYQRILPRYIRKNRFDVMINFSNYGPKRPGCRQILLLHNAKHVSDEIKSSFGFWRKLILLLQDHSLRISLKGTDKLIVQTNYMKEGVIRKFKFAAKRVSVIPNSPGTLLAASIDPELESRISEFIKDEKNILANVTLYGKHKNLENLVEAVHCIHRRGKVRLKLLLTIDPHENEDAKSLMRMIEEKGLNECILSVGNIKREYLHQLLGKARIFIFPSYAESFGLPFVEAMQFGLPIIAADLGFAHDVCGPAAVYFKHDSPEDLADKIQKLLEDDALIADLSNESRKRWSLFDAQKVVQSYLQLISEV